MNKKIKIFFMFVVATLMSVMASSVMAYTPSGYQSGSTYVVLPASAGHSSNCTWKYYIDGMRVYCVEPHVIFTSSISFDGIGQWGSGYSKMASYVYEKDVGTGNWDADEQIKQAVIWAYTGLFNVWDMDLGNWYNQLTYNLYFEAINYVNATEAGFGNPISQGGLNFTWDGNYWVSQWIYIGQPSYNNHFSVYSSGGTANSGVQRDGDYYRVVQLGSELSGPITLNLHVEIGKRRFTNATLFYDYGSRNQEVVMSGGSYQEYEYYSISGGINPVGNLRVQKLDTYGVARPGATFNVSGPGGTWNVTTGSDGTYTLSNILMGTYTVTETQAPTNMYNNPTGKTGQVTVQTGQTATFTRTNSYPRGSSRIRKFDSEFNWDIKGHTTLSGAQYTLYASENIYEGTTLIYSSGQAITTVTTDALGYTPAVTNLPIGKYYYLEKTSSTGFNLNTQRSDFQISYAGQDVSNISQVEVLGSERVIKSNLTITKRLSATDYDAEINLAGSQFSATLTTDSSQVYYSTTSGSDGLCKFTDIVYGEYIIREIKTPDSALPVADFNIQFYEDGRTYTATKIDTSKVMKIKMRKVDAEKPTNRAVDFAFGDAVIQGAEYTIYRNAAMTQVVDTIVVNQKDAQGYWYAESKEMRIGEYWVKETKAPEGYLIDSTVYYFNQSGASQSTRLTNHVQTSSDVVKKGTVRILKRLSATDYDPEINLVGAQFKLTLNSDPTQVYYTNTSVSNGICEVNNVPYGTYTVTENIVPSSALKIDDFTVTITNQGEVKEFTKVDISKVMKIKMRKVDAERPADRPVDFAFGDAVIEGAEYTIYRNAAMTQVLDTIVVDKQDAQGYWYAESKEMRVGEYWVKETKAPEGYLIDETVYYFNQPSTAQTIRATDHMQTSSDVVKKGTVRILKRLNATDYDPEINLVGVQFKLTLDSDPTQVYYTNISGIDGICEVRDVPYGTYTVTENICPPEALKVADFSVTIKDQGELKSFTKVDTSKVMKIKIRKIDANRKDTDPADFQQGDAVLKYAEYTVYRDAAMTQVLDVIVVDKQDAQGYWYAETKEVRVGEFWVKETKPSEGYLLDETVYYFNQPAIEQTVRLTNHMQTSKEEVMRGSLDVIKYDNVTSGSTEKPATGAILRFTLDSNPSIYYDATIDEYGWCEFVDEEDISYYPYTIPYGRYTITEIRESDDGMNTSFFLQPEKVVITRNEQKEYRIEADMPIMEYIKVVKKDEDTNVTIELAGAEFKIWDSTNNEFVKSRLYPSGEYTEVLSTNTDGVFTTPQKLEGGDYILYEIKAPTGYYLPEEYRLGNEGYKFSVHNTASYVFDRELTLEIVIKDKPLMARLEIIKTGEMLTEVRTVLSKYIDEDVNTPIFKQKPLANVEYTIKAANDIYSPDGQRRYQKGQVVDVIITNTEGKAITKELYPGEFEVIETKTPLGYVTDTTIPNAVITSEDELVRVQTTTKELTNARQKIKITFDKAFEDIEYALSENEDRYAVFGIYADQDFRNNEGNIVIYKDTLVEEIKTDANDKVLSTGDLPIGRYYVKEIYVTSPYSLSETEVRFEITPDGTEEPEITLELNNMLNEVITTTLTLIKISTTSMADTVTTPIKDLEFDQEIIDENVVEFLNCIKNMTIEQVKEYMIEKSIAAAKGAKYGIYMDEACTKPLYMRNSAGQYEELIVTVNEFGMATLEGMPLGRYYIKEIEAPNGYGLSDKIGTVELTIVNKDTMVYIALCDDEVKGLSIGKTDIFTGEKVPNCVFEIAEKETDTVMFKGKTNGDGECYIPVTIFKNGIEYTFTEIEAPDLYDMELELNTEPHTFVASYDEDTFEWTGEKLAAENYRKTSDVELQKLDLADSTVIPNCEFELKSLETDFVVRGVTDENGIYIFKNIPYGEYTYTEISAPEEYMIDTEPHYLKVDAKDIKIVVTNEKAPETGDIAVYAIAGVAGICVLGLAYVFIKNKKKV